MKTLTIIVVFLFLFIDLTSQQQYVQAKFKRDSKWVLSNCQFKALNIVRPILEARKFDWRKTLEHYLRNAKEHIYLVNPRLSEAAIFCPLFKPWEAHTATLASTVRCENPKQLYCEMLTTETGEYQQVSPQQNLPTCTRVLCSTPAGYKPAAVESQTLCKSYGRVGRCRHEAPCWNQCFQIKTKRPYTVPQVELAYFDLFSKFAKEVITFHNKTSAPKKKSSGKRSVNQNQNVTEDEGLDMEIDWDENLNEKEDEREKDVVEEEIEKVEEKEYEDDDEVGESTPFKESEKRSVGALRLGEDTCPSEDTCMTCTADGQGRLCKDNYDSVCCMCQVY